MNQYANKVILLCYGYHPNTTAVYFERAFKEIGCKVISLTTSGFGRPGFPINVDIYDLVENGYIETPDLLLFVDSPPFFPRNIERMKCPTACYLIDTHVNKKLRLCYAPFFDHVFIAQKRHVEDFRNNANKNTQWLPLACDPAIHGCRAKEKVVDVGFVGNVHERTRRGKFLSAISQKFVMNDYRQKYAKEDISEVYSQARIVFNIANDDDLNMRVFEGMASGSMLLTEKISAGQSDLFENGRELVEYESLNEALELIDYYIANDRERESIAAAGHMAVLEKHTYNKRCLSILQRVFDGGVIHEQAPARSFNAYDKKILLASIWNIYKSIDPFAEEIGGMTIKEKLSVLGLAINTITKSTGRNFEKMFTRGMFKAK